MHDKLLEISPRLAKENLIQLAKDLGLEEKRFAADLDGMKHAASIEEDKKLALELDLYNTPTFFINGRMVIGNRPYPYMKKLVGEEIENAAR